MSVQKVRSLCPRKTIEVRMVPMPRMGRDKQSELPQLEVKTQWCYFPYISLCLEFNGTGRTPPNDKRHRSSCTPAIAGVHEYLCPLYLLCISLCIKRTDISAMCLRVTNRLFARTSKESDCKQLVFLANTTSTLDVIVISLPSLSYVRPAGVWQGFSKLNLKFDASEDFDASDVSW